MGMLIFEWKVEIYLLRYVYYIMHGIKEITNEH